MTDIGTLVDFAIAAAEIEDGVAPELVQARMGGALRPENGTPPTQTRANRSWSPAEIQFLQEHPILTAVEIAERLGRSENAVKIRRIRSGIPAASKAPGWISATQAGKLLGTDPHKVTAWVDAGIIPARVLPGERGIRMIPRSELRIWALNPQNWILFDPEQIQDQRLRRMARLRAEHWGDRWLTTPQVGEMHGVDQKSVYQRIRRGDLPAVQVPNLAGRSEDPGWGTWFVRESDTLKIRFTIGRGKGSLDWSCEGDAFLLLGRAVGHTAEALDRMQKNPNKRADYRLRWIVKSGEARDLIDKFDLPVLLDPDRVLLFADWREHRRCFPRLAKAMDRLGKGCKLTIDEIRDCRAVMVSWMDWYEVDGPRIIAPIGRRQTQYDTLMQILASLLAAGINPLDC